MATPRNLSISTVSQAFAHYPKAQNHEKEIFIQPDWTLDDIVEHEFNDGMLIFAYRKSDQRVAIVAPRKKATKSQHDSLMARVRTWLAALPGTPYKTGYKDLSYAVLDGAGIIVQVPQKGILLADGSTVYADVIQLIEDWLKTATYTLDDDDDGNDGSDDGNPDDDDPDNNDGSDDGNPDNNPDDDPDNDDGSDDGNPDNDDPDDGGSDDDPDDDDPVKTGVNMFRRLFEEGGGKPHSWRKGKRV